jgi:hypothetical protein
MDGDPTGRAANAPLRSEVAAILTYTTLVVRYSDSCRLDEPLEQVLESLRHLVRSDWRPDELQMWMCRIYMLVGVQHEYLDESAAWFEPIILALDHDADGDEPALASDSMFTVIDRRLRRREKQGRRLHDAEFDYNLHFGPDRPAEWVRATRLEHFPSALKNFNKTVAARSFYRKHPPQAKHTVSAQTRDSTARNLKVRPCAASDACEGGECATSPRKFGTVRHMQGMGQLVALRATHSFHASVLTTERTENHFGEARQKDARMTIRHYISFEQQVGLVQAIQASGGAHPPSQHRA